MKRSLIFVLVLHTCIYGFGQFQEKTNPLLGLRRPVKTVDSVVNKVGQNIADRFKFENLRYREKVDLYRATFLDTVTFRAIDFDKDVAFTSSIFENLFGIDYTHFNSKATFLKAKFYNYTLFDSIQFRDQAYFFDAEFDSDVSFNRTVFYSDVNFQKARFSRTTKFLGVHFMGQVNFKEIILPDTLIFRNIKSKEIIDLTISRLDILRRTQKEYCYIDLTELDLDKIKFRYDNFRFIIPQEISKADYDRLVRLFQKQIRGKGNKGVRKLRTTG